MKKVNQSQLTRRSFMGSMAAASTFALARAQEGRPQRRQTIQPQAPDGRPLKAGLIGCGGRGTGAATNFLDAAPNLQIVALADTFQDRVDRTRQYLKEQRGQEISEARCFVGFDAYQKLIDSDVDVVLQATPPHFRPQHFVAIVEAEKHAFLEKPLGVDPVGARQIMQTAEKAKSKGLSVMTGTQLRRDLGRIEAYKRVQDGAIGDVLAIRCIRNQGALWYRDRQEGWSDMEYMIRDWVNWTWLSGDFIVEQFIHQLDQINWFMGSHPIAAVGMGGRARRPTGDQYDFFAVDYEFPGGVHMQSTTRQLNGCTNVRAEMLIGTKAACDCTGKLYDLDGKLVWQYEGPENNPIVQEHVDLVAAIRSDKPVNTVKETAISTLVAVMGRDSAYSGDEVRWDDLVNSQVRLGPTEYAMGPVAIEATPPVPGVDQGAPRRA
ncbi:MAG: Gfo/Idh/MocA family protein [Acidobacteriota bacterium]